MSVAFSTCVVFRVSSRRRANAGHMPKIGRPEVRGLAFQLQKDLSKASECQANMKGFFMLAILDLQHVGKPQAPADMGAGSDLNGNGRIETFEMESSLAIKYISSSTLELTRRGHLVSLLCYGDYSARQAQANNLARELRGCPESSGI